jgi:hypothetical protein
MGQLIILSNNKKLCENSNDNPCSNNSYTSENIDNEYYTNLDNFLSKLLTIECLDCLKKFVEKLPFLGLYRFYWKPLMFRRYYGEYEFKTCKHILNISIKFEPGNRSVHYISSYSANVKLTIRPNYNKEGYNTKTIELYNFKCNYNDKNRIKDSYDFVEKYLYDSFGIDISKWGEVYEHKMDSKVDVLF